MIRYQLRPGKSVYDYQQGLGDPSATEPELARLREWAEKITDEFAADKSQQKRVPHFARLDIIFRTTAPLKREKLKRAIQARADEDQEAEWMKGGKFEVANFYDEDAS